MQSNEQNTAGDGCPLSPQQIVEMLATAYEKVQMEHYSEAIQVAKWVFNNLF